MYIYPLFFLFSCLASRRWPLSKSTSPMRLATCASATTTRFATPGRVRRLVWT